MAPSQSDFTNRLSLGSRSNDFYDEEAYCRYYYHFIICLKTELTTPYLHQVVIARRDTRIFYLGFTYRFGKLIKKSNDDKLQFDNNL